MLCDSEQPTALFALEEGIVQAFGPVFQRIADLLGRYVLLKSRTLPPDIQQNGHGVCG